MILDSLVILIMKNVNIARLYFLYGGLYWKILAKTLSKNIEIYVEIFYNLW